MKFLIKISLILTVFLAFSFSVPYAIDRFINRTIIKSPYEVSEAAKKLHKNLVVIDLHSDVLSSPRNILEGSKVGHVDVPRLIEGNVAIQAFTVVTEFNFTFDLHNMPSDSPDIITAKVMSQRWPTKTWGSLKERALYQASIFDKAVLDSKGHFFAVKTKQDIERYFSLRENNKLMTSGFLGMEGLQPIEGKIENIDVFFDAGFRMMAPTHFFDNKIGGSAHGIDKGGLTDLGVQSIKRMEALNITLDLSHASEALIDDALGVATHPILVSHTGVRGTCDNARNLSDKHIKGIADTGGVIGIGFFKLALCGETLQDLVDAIVYTVNLVGIDHVGLGSDYDGLIAALFDSSGFSLLTQELLEEGLSEEDIAKIMGGNTLRVLLNNLPNETLDGKPIPSQ